MDGSNGNIVSLLERIAKQLVENKEATDKGFADLRADMNAGFAAVNARIDGTNARIDNVLGIGGSRYLDHEQRIQTLEQRVLGKSG